MPGLRSDLEEDLVREMEDFLVEHGNRRLGRAFEEPLMEAFFERSGMSSNASHPRSARRG